MISHAVATPYVGLGGVIRWEWNFCPDCGKEGAHHYRMFDGKPRFGVRCG